VTPGFPNAEERWHNLTTQVGCDPVDIRMGKIMQASHGTNTSAMHASLPVLREEMRVLVMNAVDSRMDAKERRIVGAIGEVCPLETKDVMKLQRRKHGPSIGDLETWAA